MQREFKISLSQEFYSDIVYLSQYDSDYPVIFTVTDKYSKASGINGYTAKFTGTRGDGTGLGFTYTATAIGHTVSFTIDTMLTGVAGTHTGEIIFYDQNDLYFGTANVQIIVEPAARPDGTIDADEEELRDLAQQCQDIVDTAAAEVKGEAESWAVGERDGEPVPSTDPTYHNNAKYYAEQAQDIADSIGIDATLSISGKAADAKKTGDEISSLKEDLTNAEIIDTDANNMFANAMFTYTTVPYPENIWLIGKILPNGGIDSHFTNVARHNASNIRDAHAGDKITANNGYLIQVVGKKSADYTATGSRWVSGFCKSFVIPEAGYIGVNVMLEDGSDISDANVAGANVNYYRESSVITSINTDINDLDARTDTLEAQSIVVNKNIEAIDLQLSGSEYIGTTWVRGVAGTDGTVTTSATWGLSCTEILSYSRPVRITVATGYRFFLRYYNSSGTYTTSSAWITTYLDVTANQKFMITVAKYPEDTSHNSNLDWYKNVTIPSLLFSEIEAVAPIQWNGKQWYAFGTSLSDTTFPMPYDLGGYTGKYPPYLASLSGLVHTNYAIGGSRISDSATADRNTVYQQLQDTDLTGADLITIDGLVNDWTHNTPIGELDDSTDTTIYGALNLCIDEIAEQNANATIVLITDSTGKRWTTPGGTEHPAHVAYYDKNSLGLYQSDYVEAMKKYAQYVGILCIDAGEISQINALHPQYLQDQIHHSVLGGMQFANAIWSVLKNVQPNVT